MAYAIVTKYLGPTNIRGARVKATSGYGSLTIGFDHAAANPYAKAAEALATRFKCHGPWIGATLPDGNYCFVRGGSFGESAFIVEIDP